MAKRGAADLSVFSVRTPAPAPVAQPPVAATESRDYIKKASKITRQADKQLAMLSIEADKHEYELVAEALNLLFQKYGKPPVA
jgi:hypothetical protein